MPEMPVPTTAIFLRIGELTIILPDQMRFPAGHKQPAVFLDSTTPPGDWITGG